MFSPCISSRSVQRKLHQFHAYTLTNSTNFNTQWYSTKINTYASKCLSLTSHILRTTVQHKQIQANTKHSALTHFAVMQQLLFITHNMKSTLCINTRWKRHTYFQDRIKTPGMCEFKWHVHQQGLISSMTRQISPNFQLSPQNWKHVTQKCAHYHCFKMPWIITEQLYINKF